MNQSTHRSDGKGFQDKLRTSERGEDYARDNENGGSIEYNKSSVVYPLSIDIANVSEHVPNVINHPQYIKRRRRRRRILIGLSVLTCFTGLCIYYYDEILLNNPFVQMKRKHENIDPALHFTNPELVPTRSNKDDKKRVHKEARNLPDENKVQEMQPAKFNALSTFLSSIGYDDRVESTGTGSWDFDGPPVKRQADKVIRSSPKESTRMTTTTSSTTTMRRDSIDNEYDISDSSSTISPIAKEHESTTATTTTGYSDILFVNNQLHAAEALQCRESVKNFVINATDGKDECDGLIKAYDKTCSNNVREDEPTTRQRQRQRRYLEQFRYIPYSRKIQRKLWNKLNVPFILRWRALVYHTTYSLKRFIHKAYLYSFGNSVGSLNDVSEVLFFAEDEVLKVWDDMRYMVENNIETIVQSDARRLMHEGQCVVREKEVARMQQRQLSNNGNSDFGDYNNDEVQSLSIEKPVTTTTASSLQLPIKSQDHLSDQVTNNAIFFQQNDVMSKADNATTTAREEPSKPVLFNDPTSKDAITCCSSILNVYHELCSTDVEEQVSDKRLFFFVFVLACCGMVKSLIRHFKILWLPEAAGCILVGVVSGYVLEIFPHHEVSFDGNWFLRILVPPIIFQAALSIDKRSFNRHIVPIIIYAVAGTLIATFLTAVIVHYGTMALSRWCEPIPYVEALTFGALISSIDPIAVLSVLNNMGMNDTDTIYVLIFGESLLNDGVAIVLFHTLVHFLDEELIIDQEAIIAATVHFFVVAFGSLLVGVASGMISTVYFWAFHGCQTPLVEVLMFICWALLPYYVCDGIGWSGIVAAVAVGFVMDLHIIGQLRVVVEDEGMIFDGSERTATSFDSDGQQRPKLSDRVRRPIFNRYGHLSAEARAHVGFVTEIMATGMETAIFAYLGFFLFSHRYHWNLIHMITAIVACCGSRAIMIPSLSLIANGMTRIQQRRAVCRSTLPSSPGWKGNNSAGVMVDKKMQFALWFAGLRGAMSFALVESIPLYDSFSGEGTRLKPELKAMTSACIMFTVFILGGYTYYIFEKLGISPTNRRSPPSNSYEVAALLNNKAQANDFDEDLTDNTERDSTKVDSQKSLIPGSAFRRQRHTQGDPMITI